jgi:hypothetical protein
MIAWTQRHPRRRNLIIATVVCSLAVGLSLGASGQSLVYTGLSFAAACRGDLHHDVVWSDQATGFSSAIEPMLVAAADRVPPYAAHDLALAKCSIGTPSARDAHLQRAIAIAPTNSYVWLQAAFANLPVEPWRALALVKRDPSDFVALTLARLVTFRAGNDINSNPDLVRGLIHYQLVADPTLAQTRFVDAVYYISKEHDADIARRHGTKQMELAAYRAAARDIIASAPPHLNPQILAFAEHGTLPQPSTRQTRPTR